MKNLRSLIRKQLLESYQQMAFEMNGMVDEERLTNPDCKVKVQAKENFIGSHCFGEWIGPKGEGIYAVFSYGEQFPLFIAEKKAWFENGEQYIYNGEAQSQTEEHRTDLRPNAQMQTKTLEQMKAKVDEYKKKFGVAISHTSVVPGVKN